AVQFAMLALLGVVFFSGFAMPLDSLRGPALFISYSLPATYGVQLFRDVMLRGKPGSDELLLVLSGMAVLFFVICLGLLHWRTRPK
ncbi:MAG: hypothetical protein M3220_10035, partial [Chloroflexota bacterium]|nr:hypothetical protein [Chloroflexota bacterium]